MNRKSLAAALTASALGLTSVVILTGPASAVLPGEPVCEFWESDTFYYRVSQVSERDFKALFVDLNLLAAGPGGDGPFTPPDYYVPMPLSLRTATNIVTIGADADLDTGLDLSQGITTGPGPNGETAITALTGGSPNPIEQANENSGVITWISDIDVKVDADGDPIAPGFPPFIDIDKSAGVLQFDLTVASTDAGTYELVDGVDGTFFSGRHRTDADGTFWLEEPDETLNFTLPGCSVTLEAAVDDPGADEDGADENGGDDQGADENGTDDNGSDETPVIAPPKVVPEPELDSGKSGQITSGSEISSGPDAVRVQPKFTG